MDPLLTAEQMRAADRFTIDSHGVPALRLMENAAVAVHRMLTALVPDPSARGVILAGTGNNGGDALAVARLLLGSGYRDFTVHLIAADKGAKLSAETETQHRRLADLGRVIEIGTTIDSGAFTGIDWVVDGLFGTGLSRPLSGPFPAVIDGVNASRPRVVIAIDIPSGLSADTGAVFGAAIRATHTVTLGFLKRGLFTGKGPEHAGEITLEPIGIPREIPGVEAGTFRYSQEDARAAVPPRKTAGHKGDYGHVYLWAGSDATQGAAGLAGLAAYRAGCGLVTLVSDRDLSPVRPRLALELMTRQVKMDFARGIAGPAALVVGPGLGTDEWAGDVVGAALDCPVPLVLDADALNLIATRDALRAALRARKAPAVATPHPAEAGRLLGTDAAAVEADRFAAIEGLVDALRCHVLLKGKGTLVRGPGAKTFVVGAGNSALSKGGSGDVLAGAIAAVLAQGVEPLAATCLAAHLHGRAAEILSARGGTERAWIASDIADAFPRAWAEIEG